MVPCFSRALPLVMGAAVLLTGIPGHAQSNLDAGKSAAQIFSETCNACHRSPRELKPTSTGFLREHYTTGAREAATMAAYLQSIGSDPSAVRQRKPPTLGAGQASPAEAATSAKPPEPVAGAPAAEPAAPLAAGRPRRPSDSIENGRLAAPASESATPGQSAAAPARPNLPEAFEE